MYINFANMQILKQNLDDTIKYLLSAKERLEKQISILAQNSELEDVLVSMQETKEKLETKIEFSKKLSCSIIRVVEVNEEGKKRLEAKIESDVPKYKTYYVPVNVIKVKSTLVWKIE